MIIYGNHDIHSYKKQKFANRNGSKNSGKRVSKLYDEFLLGKKNSALSFMMKHAS